MKKNKYNDTWIYTLLLTSELETDGLLSLALMLELPALIPYKIHGAS